MSDPQARSKCCCAPPAGGPTACCGSAAAPARPRAAWIIGTQAWGEREVPRVDTALRWADRLGAWKVRWGINRMGYRVEPGLYAAGTPGADSPVLVSANYKLSFDRLRSQLAGLDAWVLVLDSQGVNVWCAAGKGTFGTEELVRRIDQAGVARWHATRTVVVPQLAAPGVAAHEVTARTGVRVVYGPVHAADLPAFLAAGMKAQPAMRRVRFGLADRLALVPVELVTTAKWVLLLAAVLLVLAGVGREGFAWRRLVEEGLPAAAVVLLGAVGSVVLGPALLPWLPGRAFALKGLWVGLGMTWASSRLFPRAFDAWPAAAAWWLIVPAMASVLVLKFTGASTYTSLSGVRREMRIAVPLQLAGFALGVVLWLASRLV